MTKTKNKLVYLCSYCGGESIKWSGQCVECGQWNTLVEQLVQQDSELIDRFSGFSPNSSVQILGEINIENIVRISCGSGEFDRSLLKS